MDKLGKNCTDCSDECHAATHIVIIIFASIVMVIGIPGNSIVIRVFLAKRDKSTTHMLILALAFVDLVSCCITLPFTLAEPCLKSQTICTLQFLFSLPCVITSLLITTTIAIERYFATCRPYEFKKIITESRTKMSIGLCVLIPALLSIIFTLIITFVYKDCMSIYSDMKDWFSKGLIMLYFIIFTLCSTTVVVLYIRIIRSLRQQHKFAAILRGEIKADRFTKKKIKKVTTITKVLHALHPTRTGIDAPVDTPSTSQTSSTPPQIGPSGINTNENSKHLFKTKIIRALEKRNSREILLNESYVLSKSFRGNPASNPPPPPPPAPPPPEDIISKPPECIILTPIEKSISTRSGSILPTSSVKTSPEGVTLPYYQNSVRPTLPGSLEIDEDDHDDIDRVLTKSNEWQTNEKHRIEIGGLTDENYLPTRDDVDETPLNGTQHHSSDKKDDLNPDGESMKQSDTSTQVNSIMMLRSIIKKKITQRNYRQTELIIPKIETAHSTCIVRRNDDNRKQRTTSMLLIVSMIFLVTWLSFWICSVIEYFMDTTDPILKCFKKLYIINTACNPIVYSFLNARFRKDCTSTLRLFHYSQRLRAYIRSKFF